jgi:hypothetical protein
MDRSIGHTLRSSIAVIGVALLAACSGTDEDGTLNQQARVDGLSSTSTAPYVLAPRDVGLKYGPGLNALQWEPKTGKTATQLQRRVMIERLINIDVPTAYRWAKTIGTCASALNSIRATMNELTTELLPENSIRELGPKPPEPGPGFWSFRTTIYDYNNAQKALKKVQDCALAGSGVVCGASSPPTEMLELLDLRVEIDSYSRPVCVAGNPTYSRVVPSEPLDIPRSKDGLLTRLVERQPMTATQMQLLHETHAAHAANTAFRCGGPPPTKSAGAAHKALEASARDEFEHSLFRIPEFATTVDPSHSPADVCALFEEADVHHEAWMDAVMDLDMALAWRAGLAHSFTHSRLATKDSKVVYRVICDQAIESCPNSP